MSNFDKFCDEIAAMPIEKKHALINEYSRKIIPALDAIAEEGENGISIYTDFILGAVCCDGKLAKEEYELMKPFFDAAADKDVSYDEALAIFKEAGLENPEKYKKTIDLMVDLIGLISPELKNTIVTACLIICSLDGEVSKEEKEWILNLVDDNFGLTPMEQIETYLNEAQTFVLATVDGDKPKMRVLGFKCLMDKKIYFGVGDFKSVYAQLQKNPKCEILADLGMGFMRWDGTAVFSDDPRLDGACQALMPEVYKMYQEMGWKFKYFTLENGCAELVKADNSKEKIL